MKYSNFPANILNDFGKERCNLVTEDFNARTFFIIIGFSLITIRGIFGILTWLKCINSNIPVPRGTSMILAVLPDISGIPFRQSTIIYHINSAHKILVVKLKRI